MICPKGSECTESAHEVKTLVKALEWWPNAKEEDLPLTINQIKSSDGRLMVKVYGPDKQIRFSRG